MIRSEKRKKPIHQEYLFQKSLRQFSYLFLIFKMQVSGEYYICLWTEQCTCDHHKIIKLSSFYLEIMKLIFHSL